MAHKGKRETAFEALLPEAVRDSDLYRQALTHSSVSTVHNERLEFLGDAVLGCIIAHELHERFPDVAEGGLTHMRSSVVSGYALIACAKQHGIANLTQMDLRVSKARGKAAGDALEAIIGAVYLVAGFEAARTFVCTLFEAQLRTLSGTEQQARHPKSVLQNTLQRQGLCRPNYKAVSDSQQSGAAFSVCCEVPELELTAVGHGARRGDAEVQAAERILQEIHRLYPTW